jgi:hypothetical protein
MDENLIVWTKLFILDTIGTSKFVLILHGVNCKSGKPHGLILYFSQRKITKVSLSYN